MRLWFIFWFGGVLGACVKWCSSCHWRAPRARCPPCHRRVSCSGNFLLEAPPPSPWKPTPGGGGGVGRGWRWPRRALVLQVQSCRLGPAQARPTLPQGRGGSWGTRASVGPTPLSHRLLIRLKVVLKPSLAAAFLPLAPLAELEQGRDLQSIG